MDIKKINWDKAVTELNAMFSENAQFCNAVLAAGNASGVDFNYHITDETKQRFSHNGLRDAFNASIMDESGDGDSYESDVDINHFIETRENAISELEENLEAIKQGAARGFGDIIKFGPQNKSEETLLNNAKIFLTPSELEEAVVANKPAMDMVSQIDKGFVRDLTKRILDDIRKDMVAEKAIEEQEEQQEKPLEFSDMTEITGVLPKLEEMMKEVDADEISPPEATPANPDHEKPKGNDLPPRKH